MPGNAINLGIAALTWSFVGVLAGYLLGFFDTRLNTGKSVLGDVAAGLFGGLAGGYVARYCIAGDIGFYVSVVSAAVAACGLAYVWRTAAGSPRSAG
ncbi:MAG: hypothetical protein P4L84_20060 [Isosphaeraceae bacterium]|nr:hypothetical protein [Isosphaeraceae bacterium]